MVFYVNSQESNSPEEIAFLLNKCILHHPARWSELIFLCIGSDRVTGDCLGPYVGYQLFEHLDAHGIYICESMYSGLPIKMTPAFLWALTIHLSYPLLAISFIATAYQRNT